MAAADPSQIIRLGLFDSGVGGLSVLRRLHELASLVDERQFEFVYLGDTARCPYGNRDAQEISDFVAQIVGFLGQRGVDRVIMACNTSAALSLDTARQNSGVPVHDLITPTAKYVANSFRRIGVLATRGTVNAKAFSAQINYHAPQCEVVEIACPKLVPLVEAGELNSEAARAVVMEYTSQLEEQQVEAVILGCTHFPFLRRAIRELLAEHIALIDPADLLARQLISDLNLDVIPDQLNETVSELHCRHTFDCYTTGSVSSFAETAAICLGRGDVGLMEAANIQHLTVDELMACASAGAAVIVNPAVDAVSNVVPLHSNKTVETKSVAP